MKKTGYLMVIVLVLIMLTGCGEFSSTVKEVPVEDTNRFNGISEDIKIVTDSETGCKYIYIKNSSGYQGYMSMSPLIKASGIVDCE